MENRSRAKRRTKQVEPVKSESRKLNELDKEALRAFVYFCMGDSHLTAFEANFVNSMKQKLDLPVAYISIKQERIIKEIKEKLHFDRPNEPPPPLELDVEPKDDDDDESPLESTAIDDDDINILAGLNC